MSIAHINYDLAQVKTSGDKLEHPGIYGVVIEDALSKPNKAGNGTNLAVYFRVINVFEGNGKVGDSFGAYYAYENPNAQAVGIAITKIKELLEACLLPLGSAESMLIGKTCAVKMEIDKSGTLVIRSAKALAPKVSVDKSETPMKSTPPVVNAKQPIASYRSTIAINPFDGLY